MTAVDEVLDRYGVVLDADPFERPATVAEREVETTVVGGTIVYDGD